MASWSTYPVLGRGLEAAAIAMRSSTTVLKDRPFVICLNDRTACRVDIVDMMSERRRERERVQIPTQPATDTLFNKDGRELLGDESDRRAKGQLFLRGSLRYRGSLVGELNRGPVINSPTRTVIGFICGQASETGARTGHLEIFHRAAFSPQFNQFLSTLAPWTRG